MQTTASIVVQGKQQEVQLNLTDYREANKLGLTLPQFYNRKFQTNANDGLAFAQIMAATGLVMAEDRNFGFAPPTIATLLEMDFGGGHALAGGAVVAPDGAARNTPAGRLLFPAVMLDMLDSSLRDNRESYNSQFMDMVAVTRSISSNRYDRVIINYDQPRAARGMPISQLAEPNRMLSITTSDSQRSIPTMSIGMQISDQAAAAATLDMVGIALREHAIEEKSAQLENDFLGIVNGSVDAGEPTGGVLAGAFTAQSLDASILSAGQLTQRAWVKYMLRNRRKRVLTHHVMGEDTYFSLESRLGRPTRENEPATDERLNTLPKVMLPGMPAANAKVFIMENFPANTIVSLDASKALQRIVYTGAAYQAVEQFVMTRSSAIRLDWAERIESIGYADAFSAMTLTV